MKLLIIFEILTISLALSYALTFPHDGFMLSRDFRGNHLFGTFRSRNRDIINVYLKEFRQQNDGNIPGNVNSPQSGATNAQPVNLNPSVLNGIRHPPQLAETPVPTEENNEVNNDGSENILNKQPISCVDEEKEAKLFGSGETPHAKKFKN